MMLPPTTNEHTVQFCLSYMTNFKGYNPQYTAVAYYSCMFFIVEQKTFLTKQKFSAILLRLIPIILNVGYSSHSWLIPHHHEWVHIQLSPDFVVHKDMYMCIHGWGWFTSRKLLTLWLKYHYWLHIFPLSKLVQQRIKIMNR